MRGNSRTGRRVALVVLLVVLTLFNIALDIGAVSAGGGYLIYRFISGSLDPVQLSIELQTVDMTGNGSGWAVGWGVSKASNVLLRANAGHWVVQPSPPALGKAEPVTLAMDSPQDGWMIAGYSAPDPGGSGLWTTYEELLHYQDGQWRMASAPLDEDFEALTMRTASDGWIVGSGIILHWNGTQWNQSPMPADLPSYAWPFLDAVAAPSATDAWAAGFGGDMLHWDGSTWHTVHLSQELAVDAPPLDADRLTSPDIKGLAMTTPGEGWAVASVFKHNEMTVGEILKCHKGIWRIEKILPGVVPQALTLTAHGDGWIVGDHGAIMLLQGNHWVQVTSPTSNPLSSVSIAPDGQAWAGGFEGTLLHEQHGVWNLVTGIDWSRAANQRAS